MTPTDRDTFIRACVVILPIGAALWCAILAAVGVI